MQLFRGVRVPFAMFLPRVQHGVRHAGGLAALTITDDRRVDAGAAVCQGGGREVRDDNYK